MNGPMNFLGVADANAIGSRLLRKTTRGSYCHRGQDQNSKRAHSNLSVKQLLTLQRLDENATYQLG
jgi:hypothetical protein